MGPRREKEEEGNAVINAMRGNGSHLYSSFLNDCVYVLKG